MLRYCARALSGRRQAEGLPAAVVAATTAAVAAALVAGRTVAATDAVHAGAQRIRLAAVALAARHAEVVQAEWSALVAARLCFAAMARTLTTLAVVVATAVAALALTLPLARCARSTLLLRHGAGFTLGAFGALAATATAEAVATAARTVLPIGALTVLRGTVGLVGEGAHQAGLAVSVSASWPAAREAAWATGLR